MRTKNIRKIRCIGCLLLVFLVGAIAGSLVTSAVQKSKTKYNVFEYGVLSNTLTAENIKWNEYPQFRTVQFTLNGEITLAVPHE